MLSPIYVSTAKKLLGNGELLEILKVSRENNGSDEVTGLLLYKGGNLMQVLEGDEVIVTALSALRGAVQHKDVSLISKEEIQVRQFPAWQMAFQNLDHSAIKNEVGYSQFLQDEFTAQIYRTNPLRAYILLLIFRDNMQFNQKSIPARNGFLVELLSAGERAKLDVLQFLVYQDCEGNVSRASVPSESIPPVRFPNK